VSACSPDSGTGSPARPGPRLHGLDALRGGALLLGIVLHSLMPYLPGGGWIPKDSHDSTVATVVVSTIHLFRMVLFMMLAGYFGRMVVRRRGARDYVRDRGLRILLPLVVFGPLVLVSLAGVVELDAALRGTPATALPDVSPWLLVLTAPGHLWFLGVLVQCVVVTVLARAVLTRLVGPESLAAVTERLGNVLATPAVGLGAAAVPYLCALLLQGRAGDGIAQPTTVLPEPIPLIGYLGAFLVGWCLQGRGDALTRIARAWASHLVAAVALTGLGLVTGESLPSGVHAVVVALAGWAWTFGLLGACVRFLRRDRAWIRYVADASYWMYLIHLPIVMITGIVLADLAWPVLVKVVVVWAVCAALLPVSYDLMVRDTWLGAWLNGRRRPSVARSLARR
jgi:glucans biosynthesis protein C